MKLLYATIGALVAGKALAQFSNIVDCGASPCLQAVSLSCEELLEEYEFQGSCCQLQSIPQTRGCRVEVFNGNCFWFPKCVPCVDGDGPDCNRQFQSVSPEQCPTLEFDAIEFQANREEEPSCSPSMMPDTEAPTPDSSAFSMPTSAAASAILAAVGAAL